MSITLQESLRVWMIESFSSCYLIKWMQRESNIVQGRLASADDHDSIDLSASEYISTLLNEIIIC